MRNLAARLERLEAVTGANGGGLSVQLASFDAGELTGLHVHGELIERAEGEAEEQFITRVESQSRRPGQPVLVMKERRATA